MGCSCSSVDEYTNAIDEIKSLTLRYSTSLRLKRQRVARSTSHERMINAEPTIDAIELPSTSQITAAFFAIPPMVPAGITVEFGVEFEGRNSSIATTSLIASTTFQ